MIILFIKEGGKGGDSSSASSSAQFNSSATFLSIFTMSFLNEKYISLVY